MELFWQKGMIENFLEIVDLILTAVYIVHTTRTYFLIPLQEVCNFWLSENTLASNSLHPSLSFLVSTNIKLAHYFIPKQYLAINFLTVMTWWGFQFPLLRSTAKTKMLTPNTCKTRVLKLVVTLPFLHR